MSRLFDEDRFRGMGDKKLYGIRFQHFGAFLDPAWRESDFTWGRLDAVHHLLPLFVSSDDERRRAEIELHGAILESEMGPGGLDRMRENLTTLKRSGDLELLPKVADRDAVIASLEATGRSVFDLVGDAYEGRVLKRVLRRPARYVLHRFLATTRGDDPDRAPAAALTAIRRSLWAYALVLVLVGLVAGVVLGLLV